MTNAYDRIYLENARVVLARMLDYAVYDMKLPVKEFWSMFLCCGMADRFERGESTVIAGKSGVENARDIVMKSTGVYINKQPRYTMEKSPEYWAGWALAYYQWETSISFDDVTRVVPIEDIIKMYSPYHEMDINAFCDKMRRIYITVNKITRLKRYRTSMGLTQRELSEQSNVPLRTIQQYEQKQKNINNAQAQTLSLLAKALCCNVENLLEYNL